MADTAAEPETTIVPFSRWADCASDCGPLYDANGACVPPVGPAGDESTYEKCFCDDSHVAGFKTGIKGVCDEICPDDDAQKTLVQIQNWFADMCGVDKVKTENDDSDDSDDSSSGSRPSGTKAQNQGGGQSWVEMHWRWLVMIIVLVVAILVIWALAFWWRRRYLRKKELQQSLGKKPIRESWGPGAAPPEAGVFIESGSSGSGSGSGGGSGIDGAPDKPARKWWGGRG